MRRPLAVADEDRIAGPASLDGSDAVRERRPRPDRHGLAATEGPQSLFGDGWDAPRDGGFGEVSHVLKCSASPG